MLFVLCHPHRRFRVQFINRKELFSGVAPSKKHFNPTLHFSPRWIKISPSLFFSYLFLHHPLLSSLDPILEIESERLATLVSLLLLLRRDRVAWLGVPLGGRGLDGGLSMHDKSCQYPNIFLCLAGLQHWNLESVKQMCISRCTFCRLAFRWFIILCVQFCMPLFILTTHCVLCRD